MHILLVEDDERLARRLARVLTEEHHTVEVVGDGKQAILHAQEDNFDCLILDILLPEMNGIAVCRWLRAHAITTPILLLTALDEIQDKVRGLDTGADDYLTKPFSFEELLARLRALARRNTPALQVTTQLQLGSLSLHLLTREVQVDAVRIDLTVREFALLEYLLRHPHHALTRAQILAAVWPSDTEVNTTITPADGQIWLGAKQATGASIEIIVRDTGRGIAHADLPHVFTRFYRADKARTRHPPVADEMGLGGTGLGLAIAQSIVEHHGGTMTVYSAGEGQGSIFTVVLKRASATSTASAGVFPGAHYKMP